MWGCFLVGNFSIKLSDLCAQVEEAAPCRALYRAPLPSPFLPAPGVQLLFHAVVKGMKLRGQTVQV